MKVRIERNAISAKQLADTLDVVDEFGAELREVEKSNTSHEALWPETQYSRSMLNNPMLPWENVEIAKLYRVVGSEALVKAHNALLDIHNKALDQLSETRALVFEERDKRVREARLHETQNLRMASKIRVITDKLSEARGLANANHRN